MKFTMVISLLTLILPAVAVLDGPIPNHMDHDTDNNNRFPYVSDHDKFYGNNHDKRTDENDHIGPISHPIVGDDDDNRIEGYNITELEWEIEVHPETGKTIVARGTIEQIRDEALKHNPDWDAHYMEPAERKIKRALETGSFAEIVFKPGGTGTGTEFELESESFSSPHLAKRKFNLLRRLCGGPWKPTYWDTALRSAAKVTLMKGFPKQGPGPGNCGRVSCKAGTAIYWCNDEPYDKTLLGFDRIGQGAMEVINPCSYTPFGSGRKTSGQAFHAAGWNVIVRKDKC